MQGVWASCLWGPGPGPAFSPRPKASPKVLKPLLYSDGQRPATSSRCITLVRRFAQESGGVAYSALIMPASAHLLDVLYMVRWLSALNSQCSLQRFGKSKGAAGALPAAAMPCERSLHPHPVPKEQACTRPSALKLT